MKKVLIISPYFPPINAADMQRVRQCVPFLPDFQWEPVVMMVAPKYTELKEDPILLKSLPKDLRVIQVNALSQKYTRKLGLGSIALRSLYFYWKRVNQLLKKEKFDLIFFSTTQFPVLILGNYWKTRFGIPYIIDMQDPWFSDYYLSKPKSERPPKYWFSYRLNKWMEPIAMKKVHSIVSVSHAYGQTLQRRYPNILTRNCHTLTFGAFTKDFELLEEFNIQQKIFNPKSETINIVYVGRAGKDMERSLRLIFGGFKKGLKEQAALFNRLKFHFIGTSYAAVGKGMATVDPVAKQLDVDHYVNERTDRVNYFEALQMLKEADLLVLPGSDDPKYTASKLYPYILACKPLLAVFHEQSSVIKVLQDTAAGEYVSFNGQDDQDENNENLVFQKLFKLLSNIPFQPATNWKKFAPFTAKECTRQLAHIFDQAVKENNE